MSARDCHPDEDWEVVFALALFVALVAGPLAALVLYVTGCPL